MMTREFFRTTEEAARFLLYTKKLWRHLGYGKQGCGFFLELVSLDVPGTEEKFITEQDDAISWEHYEAENCRAAVLMWR